MVSAKLIVLQVLATLGVVYYLYITKYPNNPDINSSQTVEDQETDILKIVTKNPCLKQFDPTTYALSSAIVIDELNMILTRNWYGEMLGYDINTHKLIQNYSGPFYAFYRSTHMTQIPNTNHIIYDHFNVQQDNTSLVVLDLETGRNITSFQTNMPSFAVAKIVVSPYNPELAVIFTGKLFEIFVFNITSSKLVNYAPTLMNPMSKRYYEIFDMVYLPDGKFLTTQQVIENYELDTKTYAKENEIAYLAVWDFTLPHEQILVKKIQQKRSYSQIMNYPHSKNKFIMRPYDQEGVDSVGGIFDYTTLEFTEFTHPQEFYNCETFGSKDNDYIACSLGNTTFCKNMEIQVFSINKNDKKQWDKQTTLYTNNHFISDIRSVKGSDKLLVLVMHDHMHSYEGVTYNFMDILEWDVACQKNMGEVKLDL